MATVTVVLFLLLAVVLSDILARVLTRVLPFTVPKPLIQIALGSVVGLSNKLVVTLDPQVFFLLFLPPLLFLDGWRIPPEELFKDKGTVIQLALGLVVFTVLGIGMLIHWLIPPMPLPVAFALAAVLSPTDPIAVAAIAQRVPMPLRMMHILEGESLLNDASGLVCFRFAVAAMMTGTFSLPGAMLDFAWLATGGISVGVGLTLALSWLKNAFSQRLGEDSGSQILISLLIPFGCYLLAEAIRCSGILAAVAAGVTMSFVESSGQAMAATRVRRNTFWDVIQFTANGIIFVLLGEQFSGIVAGAKATVRLTGHIHPLWLLSYVLAVTLALAAMRFCWVWVSLRLTLSHPAAGSDLPTRAAHPLPNRPGWRLIAAMSLAGVRGAVTLAGVLTLPLTLPSGQVFPTRDLAVLLAMGVITVSLVAASVALPLLLRGLVIPTDAIHAAEEATARVAAAHAAIAEIERFQVARSKDQLDADIVVEAAAKVMDLYRARIESQDGNAETVSLARKGAAVEREMRLAGLRAERTVVFHAMRARTLGSESARKLIRELDLMEVRQSSE